MVIDDRDNLYIMTKITPPTAPVDLRDDPSGFVARFYERMNSDILRGDQDADVVDRYHTPDVVQIADGVVLDRDRLVDHIRPVRRGLGEFRVEVHETIASNDAVAARLTFHAEFNQRTVVTDVHFFGRFTADGRLSNAHQLTKTRKPAS